MDLRSPPYLTKRGHPNDENDGQNVKQDISETPEAARKVAKAMNAAAPSLSDIQIVLSNESDHGGQVIVIAHQGDDPKKACLKASNAISEANMVAPFSLRP